MTEKLKVSREVADAIEKFIHYWVKDFGKTEEEVKVRLIRTHNELKYEGWDNYQCGSYKALADISTFDLMQVLVNGCEVEMTPYEIIKADYEKALNHRKTTHNNNEERFLDGYLVGVRDILATLCITIEGVNDNDN